MNLEGFKGQSDLSEDSAVVFRTLSLAPIPDADESELFMD